MVAAKVKKWISQNKTEFWLVFLILLLASFLRFYQLSSRMTFLGDEGRDALVWLRMVIKGKFVLIGPVTSIGNMYLGPLYYYLSLPWYLLFGLSPVGPSFMVALLGLITVALVWWIGREWFSPRVGLIAAFLYAISPVVIVYSRSSWNPNVMPFFALLTIYGLYRLWTEREFWWLPIMGVTLSFCLQSHYLGLLLFPTVGLFWILTLADLKKKKEKTKHLFFYSFSFLFLFLFLTIAPLVWFDFRHNFINFKAFKQFFAVRQATVNLKIYKGISNLRELMTQVFTRLLAGKDEFWGKWVAVGLGGSFLATTLLYRNVVKGKKFLKQKKGLVLILVWFLVGLLGLGNYKQHIYDHYFGFFFPAPFLLTSWVLDRIWETKRFGKIAAIVLLVFLLFLAFRKNPLRQPPNNQLARTREVAQFVLEKADNQPFNLALIAERNYAAAYTYFMERWGRPPTEIEPLQTKKTITDQLFVICEKTPCEPVGHPKAEIAMFGWTQIEEKWEKEGIEIYKLVHYQP